jgi:hypothetical protein
VRVLGEDEQLQNLAEIVVRDGRSEGLGPILRWLGRIESFHLLTQELGRVSTP